MKTTEELKHVPFEMYARILDRAVKAEAERDVLDHAFKALGKDMANLGRERDSLRDALEPFAKCAAAYDGYEGDQVNYYRARRYVVDQLTVGDFRKARAALAPSPAGLSCTCHPVARPDVCQHKYSLSECWAAAHAARAHAGREG